MFYFIFILILCIVTLIYTFIAKNEKSKQKKENIKLENKKERRN